MIPNPSRRLPSGIVMALALTAVSPAFATLIVLSDTRTITATATGPGGSSTQSLTATPLAPFNQAVVASVPGANSTVNMNSSFTASSIVMSTGMTNAAGGIAGPPGSIYTAVGASVFDISFLVDETTPLTISGTRFRPATGTIDLSLSGVGNWSIAEGEPHLPPFSQSVMLAPGTYLLSGRVNGGVISSGTFLDLQPVRLDVTLHFGVPDSGTSAMLLAIGLMSLLFVRPRNQERP